MNLPKGLKAKIKFSEPLSFHTTFRLGGRVKVWAEPKASEDLQKLLLWARHNKLKIFIIGGGSNILASKRKFKMLAIHLNSPNFKQISLKENNVYSGCGVNTQDLANFAYKQGLSGCEFLSGIPGTVGGAIMMNAGTGQKGILELVEELNFIDFRGRLKKIKRNDLRFYYRSHKLPRGVYISAILRLRKENKFKIRKRIAFFLRQKKKTQEYRYPSAGCIFKNPSDNFPAGKLIEACRLKGRKIGGAEISQKHANFIINRGSASFGDVKRLMVLCQKRVLKRFRLKLEPEVKIVD